MLTATEHSKNLRSVYRSSPWGGSFHYNEAGWNNEKAVLLVHGFAAHAMTFRRVVDALGEDYHVIVPDLPGHGRDETFRATGVEPTFDMMIEWLDALMDTLHVDVAHLLGHSLGGTMAYYLAARGAHEITSLALVSPGLRLRPMPLASQLVGNLPAVLPWAVANRLGFMVYEPINWRGEKMGVAERIAYLEPLKQRDRLRFMLDLGGDLLATPDRRDGLRNLGIPSVLIWGRSDHVVPIGDAPGIQSLLGGPPLHVIDRSGHSPMEDNPGDFANTYLEFLQEL